MEPMRLLALDTVRSLGVAEFRDRHFERRRPVVLRGAVAGWPALARWSDQFLSETLGDLRVRAYSMPRGRIELDPRTGFRVRDLTLRTFIRELAHEGDCRYFLRTPFDTRFAIVSAEVPAPPYCGGARGLRRNLWMSGEGLVTQLHFDLPDNLIAMVRGRKRFFVFPPSERRHLYAHSWFSSVPHVARVDPESPDDELFPDAARARGWECELDAGDVLYLPPRFWHHARSLSPTISINHWWCRPASRALLFVSDTYKRIRGLEI